MSRKLWLSTASAALISAALAPAWAPCAAQAQSTASQPTTLSDVVVTARRKSEALQKVPEAISAVRQASIDTHGVFSVQTISQVAPGIHVDADIGDRTDVVLTIRGQGETYGTEYPSVLPYFAEVPLPRLTTGQFFDLQNIQVLRGPQGTLFGKVTDGGALLIVPKKPADRFEGFIEGKFGNYGLNDYTGALNIPIVEDKVLFRVSFDSNHRNGFTYDRGLTAADKALAAGLPAAFQPVDPNAGRWLDNVNYESVRTSLVIRPNEKFENYTVFSYYKADENGTGDQIAMTAPTVLGGLLGALTGPLATPLLNLAQQEVAENKAYGPRSTSLSNYVFSKRLNLIVSNATTYDLTDDLTLKNILGWVRNKEIQPNDYDGTFLPMVDTDKPQFPLWNTAEYTEELQLQGKSLQSRLNWQIGFYTDLKEPEGPQENLVNQFFGILERTQAYRNIDRSQAGYAQGTYDFSNWIKGLSLTAGLRYTAQQNKSVTNNALILPAGALPAPFVAECNVTTTPTGTTAAQAGDFVVLNPDGSVKSILTANPAGCAFPAHSSEDALTYNFTLNYAISPDKQVYFATRKGFKGGGFNATYTNLQQQGYGPEYIHDYEVGFKGDWTFGDMKARTNVALYRADESKIQRLVQYIASGSPSSYVTNAPDAVVQGVEFEGTLVPITGLQIGLTWAYTDAHYVRNNVAASCNLASPTPVFCELNPLQDTPQNQASVDVHYTIPMDERWGSITFGGSWNYQSAVALTDNAWESGAAVGLPLASIQAPYALLNFDATWSNVGGRPIDATFFVTNATNKVYRIGADDSSYNLGTVANIYGEPRMVGGSLKYRFGGGS
ncbi:MAG: hypothetical protein JO303_03810 [Caulobacteraceae bacterium]|nr:hypothetical protein [Caulobacteraceae bacterium]